MIMILEPDCEILMLFWGPRTAQRRVSVCVYL